MNGPSETESADAKKAVFRRLVDTYARRDLDALNELVVPDYIGHASAGDRNLEEFRQSIAHFHSLFVYEDDSFIIEDQLVDGDKVVTRMTAHLKERATGAPVTMLGINIAIIVAGKLIEEWNVWEPLQALPPQPISANP